MASQAASPVVVQRQQSTARRHHSRQSSTSGRPPTVTIRQADNANAVPQTAREQDRLVPGPSGHRSHHSRDHSDAGANGGHHPHDDPQMHQHQKQQRKTTIKGESGTWVLGKTIGAGSMGKVKLARKLDGSEQVGISSW